MNEAGKSRASVNGHVAVIGAGSTGLTAALALLERGFRVDVLEAGAGPNPTSRAGTLQPSTLMLFERLGIVADVLAIGRRAPILQFRELAGPVVAQFDFGLLADVTPYPFRLHCAQDQLTRLLLERVLHRGGTVTFGCRVVGVSPLASGNRVQWRTEHGEAEGAFSYVVGADGSASSVRKAAGIALEGERGAVRMVQCMTTADLGALWPDLSAGAYFMDPLRPCLLTQVPDSWRILIGLPEGVVEDDDAERAARDAVERLLGVERPLSVFRETMYAIRPGLARTFFERRVMLVGDAAHVSLPFAATGLNAGLHDAYFLAKALYEEEVLDEPRLCEWAEVRRADTLKRVIGDGTALYAALRAAGPGRKKRNARLAEIAGDRALARAYLSRSAMLDGASIAGVV